MSSRPGGFERALEYLLPPCRGARGPLWISRTDTEMRPGPQASYRLADYLEQFGKQTRSLECPQDKFWLAALRDEVADRDRTALACAAYARGRTVIAYRLADAAMTGGNAVGHRFLRLRDPGEGRPRSITSLLPVRGRARRHLVPGPDGLVARRKRRMGYR